MINFNNIDSLKEAQAQNWITMPSLKAAVTGVAAVYSIENHQLLIVGRPEFQSETCGAVQYFDMKTKNTGIYHGTYNNTSCADGGSVYSGMYAVEHGDFSIFGGSSFDWGLPSCMQQKTFLNDIQYFDYYKWACLTSSELLEGLSLPTSKSYVKKPRGKRRNDLIFNDLMIRFSNFIIQN